MADRVTKTTTYRTQDGKTFDTLAAAQLHDRRLQVADVFADGWYRDMEADAVVEFVLANAYLLSQLLRDYANLQTP